MKVTKKSRVVKQNGSMADRQERTYWSGQGVQQLFSTWWRLCKKMTERRKKNNNNKKNNTDNNQHRFLRYERVSNSMAPESRK